MGSERDACVDDERLVISEVHIGSSAVEEEAEVVSRYTYLVPSDKTGDDDSSSCSSSDIDSDNNEGDATGRGSGSCSSPTRRRKRPRAKASSTTTTQRRSRPAHEVLTIVHRMATPLGLVGQQVWSAAFLLGDFVLTHPKIFAGVQVLELGAGPGVAGLVAARVARRCYLTDYHNEVLKLLSRNVEANLHLFAQGRCSPTSGNGTTSSSAAAGATTPAATTRVADATINDSDNGIDSESDHDIDMDSDGDSSGGSAASGAAGDFEKRNTRGGRDRRGGNRPPGRVAAVRELDWFTFSQEEGPTDRAVCPQGDLRALSNGDGTQKATTTETEDDDKDGARYDCDSSFNWRRGELERLSSPPLPSETGEPAPPLVILAADVIYDEGLTEAFFDVLKLLMPPPPPPPPSPPSNGDDGDQPHHHGVSRETNRGGCVRGMDAEESGHKHTRDSPPPSTSSADDVSEDDEPLSSPSRQHQQQQQQQQKQRQGFAGSVAPLLNANNVGVDTDSKEEQEKEDPPPSGRQAFSSFGPGGAGGGGEAVVLYLALEKRFNFSLAELSVSATGYKALLGNVVDVTDGGVDGGEALDGVRASKRKAFEGIRLPLKFQQCFRYKRSDAMEIWEIRRRPV